jgi:hypothetical protein
MRGLVVAGWIASTTPGFLAFDDSCYILNKTAFS